MESTQHSLSELFEQLGLSGHRQDIEQFIEQHKGNVGQGALHQASFWNDSQASFLRQSLAEDADWAELVDQLDVLLRNE
ncbi:DUF2789 domain-containing protein [Vibrio sp. AK197]